MQGSKKLNDEFYFDGTNIEHCKIASLQVKLKVYAFGCYSGSSIKFNLPLQ